MNAAKKTVQVSEDAKKSLPFLEQTPNTDLILLVEGQKLFVNKTILTFASPVWAKMLTADFKEKGASEKKLPGKTVRSVVAFLRCVYPDIIDEIDNGNVYHVLPLAEEYQCYKLKEKCENYFVNFLSIQKDVDSTLKSLLASCKYNLKRGLEASADVLCDRSLSTLESNQLWNKIPTEGKLMVCMKRSKLLEGFVQKIRCMLHENDYGNTGQPFANSKIVNFLRNNIDSTNNTS